MKTRGKVEHPRKTLPFHYLFLASVFGPSIHLFHGRLSDWTVSTIFSTVVLAVIFRKYSELRSSIKGVVSAFIVSCVIFYLAYLLPDPRYKLLPGIAWFVYFTYFIIAGQGKNVYELMCAHDSKVGRTR